MDRPEGVSVRLTAPAPPSSFQHEYKLSYVVSLSRHQLSTDIHLTNTGNEDFKFQALLHSYFAVPDVSKITIGGLDGEMEFWDKAAGGVKEKWTGGELKIEKETDRSVLRAMRVIYLADTVAQGVLEGSHAGDYTGLRVWWWIEGPIPWFRGVSGA
jgi:D-hexose-6-phosphate mutarotase